MPNNIITEFPISIYGNLQKYNETISKGRCRIFYKYGNRNGGYITDEFAEKLLATLPYTPVKGIFDNGDYTDHGESRSEGRIYGIVPENPNVSWEEHLDEDGVTRSYACADVLIFTALYAEASTILEKGQSMELYVPSLKGQWQFIEGRRYYVYEEGCFLGLQILGEGIEPCFEGASFYTLYNDLKNILDKIEEYNLKLSTGGKTKMVNYKLSDDQKFRAIWCLLNPNYNEQGGWLVEYDICAIYDEYALVSNYAEGTYERIYYTKDDENDSLTINARERCYIMDVSESEKNALESLQKLHNNTFEQIDSDYQEISTNLQEANHSLEEKENEIVTLREEKSNFSTKYEEEVELNSTLITERDTANHRLNEANETINSLNETINGLNGTIGSLTAFKLEVEKKQKEQIIAKYADILDETILDSYSLKIDEYQAEQLDKDLAYEAIQSNPAVFSKNINGAGYIPKDEPVGGITELLNKYKK